MRCPACGAFAMTLPHPEHHWVCAICGAPRVVMPEGEPLPEEATLALREAATAQRTAAMQRLMTWAMGIPAGMALLLAIALAPASFIAAGAIIGTGIVLALLASRASRRAATERKRLRGAVERAYESAIGALASKDQNAQQIATALRVPEADVEAALAVHGQVRVDVSAAGGTSQAAIVIPQRIAAPAAEPEPEAAEEMEKKT